jgi:hypothetical protein
MILFSWEQSEVVSASVPFSLLVTRFRVLLEQTQIQIVVQRENFEDAVNAGLLKLVVSGEGNRKLRVMLKPD